MKYLFLVLLSIYSFSAIASDEREQLLDSFHQAAAEANYQQYFDLLTDDAIFLGTAPDERWDKASFARYAKPYFLAGKGWTYTATERNISLLAGGEVAFFDETLHNDSYGNCRGSGVLVITANGWKIAQYNLSIPIPNALSKAVVSQISQSKRAHHGQ